MEAKNATVSVKDNIATKLPSGKEETVVGVTQGSDTFRDGSLNHTCNCFNQMVLLDQVRIGTDCSGMEVPTQAIKNLNVGYTHVFSCDRDPHVRAIIDANFSPNVMYLDITSRKNEETPESDVYVVGFPCQPFSLEGLGEGFNDKGNKGNIFFYVLDYIRTKKNQRFLYWRMFLV